MLDNEGSHKNAFLIVEKPKFIGKKKRMYK